MFVCSALLLCVTAAEPPYFYGGPDSVFTRRNVGIGTSAPLARLHVSSGPGMAVILPGLRLIQHAECPSVVGGSAGNEVAASVVGAVIAGGGHAEGGWINRVTDDYTVIGGGVNNQAGDDTGTTADGAFATVGGGSGNTAGGLWSTVGGGLGNTASSQWSTVSGGESNTASNIRTTVSGGVANTASNYGATVGGGAANTADGRTSVISGGFNNITTHTNAAIGGGADNNAGGWGSTIPGGARNGAAGHLSFAAGLRAKANHDGAFVWGDATEADFASTAANQFLIRASGGVGIGTNAPQAPLHVSSGPGLAVVMPGLRLIQNAASPNVLGGYAGNHVDVRVVGATVAGGGHGKAVNRAMASYASVGGGQGNTAAGESSTVGGGRANDALGDHATASGGDMNAASGNWSTVGGGIYNLAGGREAVISGGSYNAANGHAATVPGGSMNTAVGNFSFAAGRHAKALHHGAFVWGDSANDHIVSTRDDQFLIRANGGVGIGTNDPRQLLSVNGSAGKPGGGAWAVFSDARLKERVVPLHGVLDHLLRLRGREFEYTADALARGRGLPGRQIGMIAQEVAEVFPDWVETDREGYLFVTERATTALLVESVRELRAEKDAQLAKRDREIDALRAEKDADVASLRRENAELRRQLERLERAMRHVRASD